MRGRKAILDLHTDAEAVPYVYVHRRFWPAANDLVGALAPDLTIVWDDDEDSAFEGAVLAHWVRAGQTEGRLVATLELRGQSDVSDAFPEPRRAGSLHVPLRARRDRRERCPTALEW